MSNNLFNITFGGAPAGGAAKLADHKQTTISAETTAAAKEEIKGKTLGTLLSEWRNVVREQREDFHKRAAEVAQWDAHLRRAHVDLHDLECTVEQLKQDSEVVNDRLTSVGGTVDDMNEKLDAVEREIEKQLEQFGSADFGAAQRARMGAYAAALELDAMLTHLEGKLEGIEREMKDEQHELSADPIAQLMRGVRAEESNMQMLQQEADRVKQGSIGVTHEFGGVARGYRGGGGGGGGGYGYGGGSYYGGP